MTRTTTCSHCHAACRVEPGQLAFCSSCGHRADLPRMDCDCSACRADRKSEGEGREQ